VTDVSEGVERFEGFRWEKTPEVERFEGLVGGEGGFPKRKLYGLFTRCYG
jgi:hypothetical protein